MDDDDDVGVIEDVGTIALCLLVCPEDLITGGGKGFLTTTCLRVEKGTTSVHNSSKIIKEDTGWIFRCILSLFLIRTFSGNVVP